MAEAAEHLVATVARCKVGVQRALQLGMLERRQPRRRQRGLLWRDPEMLAQPRCEFRLGLGNGVDDLAHEAREQLHELCYGLVHDFPAAGPRHGSGSSFAVGMRGFEPRISGPPAP